jgi:hypothetical protein
MNKRGRGQSYRISSESPESKSEEEGEEEKGRK